MIVVDINILLGLDTLAGAGPGRELAGKLIDRLPRTTGRPQLVITDMRGIQFASASFVREGLFGFRDWVRKERPDLYSVVANVCSDILEEIALIGDMRGALLTCHRDKSGVCSDFEPIGKLDPKARFTFDLICELGEAGVSDLVRRESGVEKTKPTAWSNRLAGLVELGLVAETQVGRTKRYRPVWQET